MPIKIFKYIGRFFLFLVLTLITQIGGILYVFAIFIAPKWKTNFRGKTFLMFFLFYSFTTFIIIPYIAPIFGREQVISMENVRPTNYFTVFLNRNYVNKKLNDLLRTASIDLKKSNNNIQIKYLDANFPFFDGFPLFPHLSHNDGKKIDISLIYETPEGKLTNKKKSISGYGIFEAPKNGEFNQIDKCIEDGYFQYNYPKYITLGSINDELKFSEYGTKTLIEVILGQPQLGKMFIEPHLKERMGLTDYKIRYHGCKAVRHDDHIHIQL